MARVVLVHGIGAEYGGPNQMAAKWLPALRDGVALAGGVGVLTGDDMACVFYGDVFRKPSRFLGGDIPLLTAYDVQPGVEADLLMMWWEAAAQLDPAVVAPRAQTLAVRASVREALLALSGSSFFGYVAEKVVVWWLKQVSAYLTDFAVRGRVQARLGEQIGPETRVIVGHSLGSVVAYEGLCANPDWPITHLVTLGSPLGVRPVVFDRLIPAPVKVPVGVAGSVVPGRCPGMVRRWTNLVDLADFIAVQPRLRELFGDVVVDIGIDNGVKAHDVTRYLAARQTGEAVLAGLTVT